MSWKHLITGVLVVVTVPAGLLAADDQHPQTGLQAPDEAYASVFGDLMPDTDGQPPLFVRGQSGYVYGATAIRFGWWGTHTSGSLVKVGEFQDLDPSPFFDVDHLHSDGCRTLDFYITGTDNEGTQAGLYYFGPGMSGFGTSAKVDYDRYLRRLDHDPLDQYNDPNAGFPNQNPLLFMSEDNDVGGDYAIRVQKLDARFKGRLNKNVKWRLNLWGMRKQGERQATAMSQCFDHDGDGGAVTEERCHVISNRQRIDWLTMEIEPAIEARIGAATVEYSRTMRSFNQDDGTVFRSYTNNSHNGWLLPGAYPYAVVPESFTQIDRLKFSTDLPGCNHFYANLFVGNTENKHRDMHRSFGGFDVRLINRSISGLTLTTYAKRWEEDSNQTNVLLPEEETLQPGDGVVVLPELIDRRRTKVGIKGRYLVGRRQCSSTGLALTGGYEYFTLDRWQTEQQNTTSHLLHVGAEHRWSRCLDSYVRYRMRVTDDPLFGQHPGDATNTNQPEHEDLIEIGGTWFPADNFLLSAMFGINQRHNDSNIADFDEDDYPIVLSVWYAPTCRLSFSAGYGYFSNWITQDITLGQETGANASNNDTQPWNYRGETHMINTGVRYALTDCLTLSGGYEWVRGHNSIGTLVNPAPYMIDSDGDFIPDTLVTPDFSRIPGLMEVLAETTRLTAGVDYRLSDRFACYFHYNYFDYQDKTGPNTGTANMFLGGVTAIF